MMTQDTPAIRSATLSFPFHARSLSRIELALVLAIFGLLAGANGFRFSFNSAIPCGLLAVVLLALRLVVAREPIAMSPYSWAISGTLALWVLGAGTSTVVHLSDESLLNLYAGYLVPFLIFLSLVSRPISETHKCWILVAVALGAMIPWVSGLVAYMSSFGLPGMVDLFWNRYDVSRMTPYFRVAFGNTSHMALYIAIALPPMLVMAASAGISARARRLFAIASVLGMMNVLIIFSRGAILTLLLLLVFWLIAMRSFRLFAFAALLFAALAWALGDIEGIDALLRERALGIFGDDDSIDASVNERLQSVLVGWRLFAEHPLAGVGPGQTYILNEWSRAHQIIIEEGASIGIAGLVATSLLTVLVLARSARIASRGSALADFALWSGVLGWIIYSFIAGALLHLGLLIPWAGLLYGFLALTSSPVKNHHGPY
jgi:O-antigen ligase